VVFVRLWVLRQRARFHQVVLQLPWIGPTVRKFVTSQLARTLATLLAGGIPLVNALEIGVRSMNNRFMARELEDVGRRVREGEGFARALLAHGVFPDVAVKMVEVGEQTGALQDMLNSLADFYDEEIETEVGRYITLIEPALLVMMGIVIAVVVLALYLPLFELSSVMG
jgi:type IV pilus assembly protein PilC